MQLCDLGQVIWEAVVEPSSFDCDSRQLQFKKIQQLGIWNQAVINAGAFNKSIVPDTLP